MVISSWVLVALVLLTSPLMASSASPPPIPGFSEQVCTTPSRHRRLSSCPPVPSFPSPLSSPLTAHPGGASRWKTPGPLSVCEPAPVRPDQLHRHESSSSSSCSSSCSSPRHPHVECLSCCGLFHFARAPLWDLSSSPGSDCHARQRHRTSPLHLQELLEPRVVGASSPLCRLRC